MVEGNYRDEGVYKQHWTIYSGIRFYNESYDYTYVEWNTGDRELYDNRADPYQTTNIIYSGEPSAGDSNDNTLNINININDERKMVLAFSGLLQKLKDCAGASCRALLKDTGTTEGEKEEADQTIASAPPDSNIIIS